MYATKRPFESVSEIQSDHKRVASPRSARDFPSQLKDVLSCQTVKVQRKSKTCSCSECDFEASRKKNVKLHTLRHTSREDFKCGYLKCDESFKSSGELDRHFNKIHTHKPFSCDHPGCGRKYSSARALYDHNRHVHSKLILSCPDPECNYSTTLSCNLRRHLFVHQTKNEKIPCSVEGCEYKGKHKGAMEKHIYRHKTLLGCPASGCGRYFTTKDALERHVKNLHNSSGRTFECPLCFKHYQTLVDLQRHCVSHTNEKPFKCGQCQYDAATRTQIRKHIIEVHAIIEFPFIVHLLNDRECLRCKVTLPSAGFLEHCKGHVSPAAATT